MERTRISIHTSEKRIIRPLLTINSQTTTRRDNGTISLSPMISRRTMPVSPPAGRINTRHIQSEPDWPRNTERTTENDTQPRKIPGTLELAVSIELGIRSRLAIQSKQLPDLHQNALTGRDEMVSEISSAKYRGTNRSPSSRGPYRGNNKLTTNNNRSTSHKCGNCGKVWDMNHKAK